jgi:hypothetical protein
MRCPKCGKKLDDDQMLKQIDPAKIKSFAARIAGRAGRGAVKARSPAQARKAALARWGKKNDEK